MKAFFNLKNKISNRLDTLGAFKYIAWFFILFVSFDFFWKLGVKSGEDHSLLVFGFNLTSIVYPIAKWTTDATYWVVHDWWGYDTLIQDGLLLYFPNSIKLHVVWDCTGVKQMIMFAFIIALFYGPKKQKIWFIPLSMLFLNLINVLRIALTAILVKDGFPEWFIGFNEWFNGHTWNNDIASYKQFNEDWFQLFHYHLFKWLYYDGVMFILWLIWQEFFNLPFQRKKVETNK